MGYYDYKIRNRRTAIGQAIIERTTNKVLKLLLPHLPSQPTVLDIGPGAGEFARRCLAAHFEYSAIEANENYAEELRKMGAAEVVVGFAPPIPFPDSRFDLVYMSHLLEHMPGATAAFNLLQETRRVLKSGGLLCIIVPDFLHDPRQFFDGDYTHSFVTSENRLRMLLSDTEFVIVVCRALAGPFTGLFGWLAALFNKLYSRWLYVPLSNLLRPWVNPMRLGKLRSAFMRSIFVLARKV
jgi:SAM-dependent methyltransferase